MEKENKEKMEAMPRTEGKKTSRKKSGNYKKKRTKRRGVVRLSRVPKGMHHIDNNTGEAVERLLAETYRPISIAEENAARVLHARTVRARAELESPLYYSTRHKTPSVIQRYYRDFRPENLVSDPRLSSALRGKHPVFYGPGDRSLDLREDGTGKLPYVSRSGQLRIAK